MSPPSRGAWIEIPVELWKLSKKTKSPPSRGAWIEIQTSGRGNFVPEVAPLAGGVD